MQLPFIAQSQTTSYLSSPTASGNLSTIGANAWNNTSNIFANDGVSASVSTRGISRYLTSSEYGFDIPSPANIQGIRVEVLRGSSGVLNVEVLNNWSSGLTKTVSAGINRCLVVIAALETGTDSREITSMTYGGQPMTQVANIFALSGFYARIQVWILNEAGIAAAGSNTISPVFTGTVHAEYCETFSSAVFNNVDQYDPVPDIVQSSLTSPPSNSYQVGSALSTLTGSMSVAAVITGNRPAPAPAPDGAGGFTVNSSFTAGTNIYFAHASYPNSGASFMTSHKASAAIGTEQPTFTFDGTANRFAAVSLTLRRARNMDNVVSLMKGGTPVGSNRANSGVEWPTANSYISYGGSSDLWGTTWTLSDVLSTGFGSALSAIVQNGTANIDHIRITVWAVSTLPIQLMNFNAQCENGNVRIIWTTASEINNDYFTVERSSDYENWSIVHHVSGAGNSNTVNSYSCLDREAGTARSYYRLKQTDFDGTYSYSDVVHAGNCSGVGSLEIFPIPASTHFQVRSSDAVKHIRIIDNKGQHVHSSPGYVERVDIDKLKPGLYFVEINTSSHVYYEKLQVRR